jgi:polyphenol oxidase
MQAPVETFPALSAISVCQHGFIARAPGIDVTDERDTVIARLRLSHEEGRQQLGLDRFPLITAGQVHGNRIGVVDSRSAREIPGVDALVTSLPQVVLGVYVADCCAVYLIDSQAPCIALVHSGKRGTESDVVGEAVKTMQTRFGAEPARIIAQLSPCIRPPDYEVDFASEIVRQCRKRGVEQIYDCGRNTASDLARYYSYRMERGRTGRMLALIALV